jgi:hypothetical protein
VSLILILSHHVFLFCALCSFLTLAQIEIRISLQWKRLGPGFHICMLVHVCDLDMEFKNYASIWPKITVLVRLGP